MKEKIQFQRRRKITKKKLTRSNNTDAKIANTCDGSRESINGKRSISSDDLVNDTIFFFWFLGK